MKNLKSERELSLDFLRVCEAAHDQKLRFAPDNAGRNAEKAERKR
jgi:hypothetical protein